MSLFFKREREVRSLLNKYFDAADEALSAFESAARHWGRSGLRWWCARALHEWAETHTQRGEPTDLERARAEVAALEAEGVPSRIRGHNGRPDWHIYHSMFAIVEMTGATSEGCPFTCPIYSDRGGVSSMQVALRRWDPRRPVRSRPAAAAPPAPAHGG